MTEYSKKVKFGLLELCMNIQVEMTSDFLGDKMFWQDYVYILHYGLAYTGTLKKKSLNRNSNLIYKNVRVYPDKIFAKHYILVDYWSQFVTDHPKPNMEWLNKALEYWNTVLKPC
jgi:hypothetical protein